MPTVTALPEGKLPIRVLKAILSSIPPAGSVVSPEVGVDVGITRTKGKYLVSSSDPITGTRRRMGWHAVNVSANDVATSGIMPDTLNTVSLFPPGTSSNKITVLMKEINETARNLGITVAGGHTEITPGINRPIIMVTCFGSGDSFVTAASAKPGDAILMTKTAGIEGTSILASLKATRERATVSVCRKGIDLIRNLSIVPEARAAFGTGKVHAMHDVTEGGILGAVMEMSLASNVGFELEGDLVPVNQSTEAICNAFQIDPLSLIGSGTLLIACRRKDEEKVVRAVRKVARCTRVGSFIANRRERALVSRGKRRRVSEESVQDELWPTLSKYGKLP